MDYSIWKTSQHMSTNTFEINLYKDTHFSSVPLHSHNFHELYLFLSGNTVYSVENGDYKLQPYDIILIPANNLHRVEISNSPIPYERTVLWINPNYLNSISTKSTNLAKVFIDRSETNNFLIRDVEFAKSLHQKIVKIYKSNISESFGSDIETLINLQSLLLDVSRYFSTQSSNINPPTINQTVNDAIAYINKNIDKPLTLDMLAKDLYISKYYLARLFKKHTGTSPYQFIIKKRLTISKILLAKGISIKEACVQVGFGDYTHYFRAFKKEFGITPKQYLNFLQNKN